MFPKKIYLNYDGEEMWSGEPVSVTDCELQSREYTDLSQVYHHASEKPQEYPILCEDELGNLWLQHSLKDYVDGWAEFIEFNGLARWAYIIDLMPPATYTEIPNNSSKQSKS